MADGYLEKRLQDYEERRDAYRQRNANGRRGSTKPRPSIPRPEDEAL
jgi:hypothetical protein